MIDSYKILKTPVFNLSIYDQPEDEKIVILQRAGKGKKQEEKAIEILFRNIEKTLVLVSFK